MGIDSGFAKPPAEGLALDRFRHPLAVQSYPNATARQLAIDVGNTQTVFGL